MFHGHVFPCPTKTLNSRHLRVRTSTFNAGIFSHSLVVRISDDMSRIWDGRKPHLSRLLVVKDSPAERDTVLAKVIVYPVLDSMKTSSVRRRRYWYKQGNGALHDTSVYKPSRASRRQSSGPHMLYHRMRSSMQEILSWMSVKQSRVQNLQATCTCDPHR